MLIRLLLDGLLDGAHTLQMLGVAVVRVPQVDSVLALGHLECLGPFALGLVEAVHLVPAAGLLKAAERLLL
jgi:hypothetical protein